MQIRIQGLLERDLGRDFLLDPDSIEYGSESFETLVIYSYFPALVNSHKNLLAATYAVVVQVARDQVAGHAGLLLHLVLEFLPRAVVLLGEETADLVVVLPARLEVGVGKEEPTTRERNVEHVDDNAFRLELIDWTQYHC